jgi:hypothetical protein
MAGPSAHDHGGGTATGADDPVVAQRVRVKRWVGLGKRAGYLCLLVAIVAFGVAIATDLPGALVAIVIAGLVGSALTLLPATIFGYALNAAIREEAAAERERQARTARRGDPA